MSKKWIWKVVEYNFDIDRKAREIVEDLQSWMREYGDDNVRVDISHDEYSSEISIEVYQEETDEEYNTRRHRELEQLARLKAKYGDV